jgi:hypothetical protein
MAEASRDERQFGAAGQAQSWPGARSCRSSWSAARFPIERLKADATACAVTTGGPNVNVDAGPDGGPS